VRSCPPAVSGGPQPGAPQQQVPQAQQAQGAPGGGGYQQIPTGYPINPPPPQQQQPVDPNAAPF